MFTAAILKISEHDKTVVELWVKYPYYFTYRYFPLSDWPCLKWKLQRELKIKPENTWIDPKFQDYYDTLSPDL